jgi:hypothetical protein
LLARVLSGLCLIVLIPIVAIRVDQYSLRRKAERLLADLKLLEMRKSTYHDAQQVVDHWKDSILPAEPCQPNPCDVQIGVSDFSSRHWEFFRHHERLAKVWRVLGGRPAEIDGYIRVRREVVWGKGIRAVVLSCSADYEDDINLVGRMGSGSPGFISALHPEYDVGIGRPTTGVRSAGAYADFTPYADPADVNRLMDIDFSCLTRWRSCQTGADIAPAAWHEATAELEKKVGRNFGEPICSPSIIRVLARESRRAVVGEVDKVWLYSGLLQGSNSESQDDSSFARVQILLKDDLKPSSLSSLSSLQDYSFSESLPAKEKVGDRFILFFRYKDHLYSDNDRGCELLPATEKNIDAARRGVAENWADNED